MSSSAGPVGPALAARALGTSCRASTQRGPAPSARHGRLYGARSFTRRHGDPFPLPQLPTVISESLSACALRRVHSSVDSLNQLAASTSNSLRGQGHDQTPSVGQSATRVQNAMLHSIARRVSAYGPTPDDLTDESALKEIMSSVD